MRRPASIFYLTLVFVMAACGSTATSPGDTPPSSPGPAPAMEASQEPVPPTEIAIAPTVSAPGLRVIYIREGALWTWTEAVGKSRLTDTDDMSMARLSQDGGSLAFMRGREVWTVRMDGTDAHSITTLYEGGGALWFAPDGARLAVSTPSHIEVIDLAASTSNTVVTYPAIPGGYLPEVVWTPDASGFKTVIPPQAEGGQAEFLFVFTNGTVASLAKFAMLPLSESFPYLSPDGGYIIYAAKLGEDKASLFVMDSSGATRPYGGPAVSVRALGWLPNAKRFVYSVDNSSRTYLGDVMGGLPVQTGAAGFESMRFVDAEHYLALQTGDLYLGDLDGGKSLIDEGVSDFDFGW